MSQQIAPLNSLRVFVSVAKHLSFTNAAKELNMSTAAASQHIKLLENFYETNLFNRSTRKLSLTEHATEVLPLLINGFDSLAEADKRLRQSLTKDTIRVSVNPSFGAKWLLPRLKNFKKIAPHINVRMDATELLADFELDNVDVAIRYGSGKNERLISEHLFNITLVPVCSPKLISGKYAINEPVDLCNHSLIYIETMHSQKLLSEWPAWIKERGIEDFSFNLGLSFNIASIAIEAAIDGQGILLIEEELIENEIRNGSLIKPFSNNYLLNTEFNYSLVYPTEHIHQPKVDTFRKWILKESKNKNRILK